MPNTYRHTIHDLHVLPAAGPLAEVVTRVNYSIVGSDGERTAVFSGYADLTTPDPATFTPFAELTEADVVAWLGPIPPHVIEALDASLAIQQRAAVATTMAPPWVPPPSMPPAMPAPEVSTPAQENTP